MARVEVLADVAAQLVGWGLVGHAWRKDTLLTRLFPGPHVLGGQNSIDVQPVDGLW